MSDLLIEVDAVVMGALAGLGDAGSVGRWVVVWTATGAIGGPGAGEQVE